MSKYKVYGRKLDYAWSYVGDFNFFLFAFLTGRRYLKRGWQIRIEEDFES